MINELVTRYPALSVCADTVNNAKTLMIQCYENGGKLLLCGNGGSCADCDHIVGELMKGFLKKRALGEAQKEEMRKNYPDIGQSILDSLQGALPAISLPSFSALNTAFANDADADMMYAQGVLGLASKNDLLFAISTSGNAKNVVLATKTAKALGIKVIALTGIGGGELAALSDVTISVPEKETFKVQELHLPIYHFLCAEVEKHFFS